MLHTLLADHADNTTLATLTKSVRDREDTAYPGRQICYNRELETILVTDDGDCVAVYHLKEGEPPPTRLQDLFNHEMLWSKAWRYGRLD